MTTLHEQGEPCRSLDHRPREIVEATAARDTFRAALGSELHSLKVGWPVFTASPTARASDVAIELTSGATAAFELALWIPSESAARWVDRALGGNGESGLAGASGALSDGECGVLAYLAARVCGHFDPHKVVDVRSAQARDACVLWPLTLDGTFGRVPVTCALAPWRAEASRDLHRLSVSVFDRAPGPFRSGEVWISDRWNLSSTSDGLAGEVQLSVEGCASPLSAFLGAGQLRAHAPTAVRDEVELVLSERALSFMQLARIAAGEPYAVDVTQAVELRSQGRTLARGELVSWRGAVGVRITEA